MLWMERASQGFDGSWYLQALPWVRAALVLCGGWMLGRLGRRLAQRTATGRVSPQLAMVGQRVVYWSILLVALATALRQVGFDLSVLLGAAGVLSVAVGFASQTSASNLISGLFLLGERPFVVGDTIRINQTTGQVMSIDLLSVKLRTFDNLLVRVPNEALFKTEITNLTHYKIRRMDLRLPVPYGTDIGQIRQIVTAVAESLPGVLDEPAPNVIFDGISDSGFTVLITAWGAVTDFHEARTAFSEAVFTRLLTSGITPATMRRLVVTDDTVDVRLATR